MEDLNSLRGQLNNVDEKLVEAFEKRMEIVFKIGEYKRKNNIPVLDQRREEEVINKNLLLLRNKNLSEALKKLYIQIMNISKEEQKKIKNNDNNDKDS